MRFFQFLKGIVGFVMVRPINEGMELVLLMVVLVVEVGIVLIECRPWPYYCVKDSTEPAYEFWWVTTKVVTMVCGRNELLLVSNLESLILLVNSNFTIQGLLTPAISWHDPSSMFFKLYRHADFP